MRLGESNARLTEVMTTLTIIATIMLPLTLIAGIFGMNTDQLVILSIGMEPSDGTIAMAEMFNLPLECHGWIETVGGALNTVQTPVDGVFVAGAAAGPADLEDSISMGGAAALKACAFVRRIQLPVVG